MLTRLSTNAELSSIDFEFHLKGEYKLVASILFCFHEVDLAQSFIKLLSQNGFVFRQINLDDKEVHIYGLPVVADSHCENGREIIMVHRKHTFKYSDYDSGERAFSMSRNMFIEKKQTNE